MIEYADLKWKDNRLYLFNKYTNYAIVPFEVGDKDFYKIRYPDGVLSADFYNLARARDNTKKLVMSVENKDAPSDIEPPKTGL